MIDISPLEIYFPKINVPITEGDYTFTIVLDQTEDTFIINLKIKQKDTKEEHLTKFRIGIAKDNPSESKIHRTDLPHFEIEFYKREKDSFSATVYFTFDNPSGEQLVDYAKGTIVLIEKMMALFIENHKLNKSLLNKLIYAEIVTKELGQFESRLINALYACYKKSQLIVREEGESIIIKTPHNLQKYLDVKDLKPLYLPLMKKATENQKN